MSARRQLRPRTLWLLRLTLIGAALVTAIPLGARTAAAQTPETIAGRVVNGTAGGTVPEGLEVVLLTLDESKAQIVGRDSDVR